MKNVFVTLMFLTFFSINLFSNNDDVVLSGDWGENKGLRSSTPAKPVVSVEGNLLLVYFPDYLADVLITVKDGEGIVVYNSTTTTPYQGYILNIPLPVQPDNYVVTISHRLGVLMGGFRIEIPSIL
ncbi:DUF3244 domain-containing protein [Bacteroides sp. OttesenSCG-928-J23]|nr:DUF3244 domain-containing protein [Bacteroides sp. OttesenSCG-928-J23]